MDSAHSAYKCVSVGPKNESGLGTAELEIAVTTFGSFNKFIKITPELMCMDIGETRKKSRADIELLGFVASLLDLKEDQVSIKSGWDGKGGWDDKGKGKGKGKNKLKIVQILDIKLDKRELIWTLERRVGHEVKAHFYSDGLNATRNLLNKDAVMRRKDHEAFEAACEEVVVESQPNLIISAGATSAKRPLVGAIAAQKAKRLAGGATEEATAKIDVNGNAPSDQKETSPMEIVVVASKGNVDPDMNDEEPMVGLGAYDSSSDEDEDDEKPKLPKPDW